MDEVKIIKEKKKKKTGEGHVTEEKTFKKGKMTHFKLKHEIRRKVIYVLFLPLKSLT